MCCALGIGYVMQYGLPGQAPQGPVVVSDITPTSSAAVKPKLPTEMYAMGLPGGSVTLAALEDDALPAALPPLPGDDAATAGATLQGSLDCTIAMTAEPVAGAMVDLGLTAPCNASERVTIHHHGMMFTEIVQPDGRLTVTVPALNDNAVFIAAFPSGDGASAVAEVNALSFYDRVVVQWKGEAGLQLHAREYGAAYFTPGHVWAAAAGDLGNAARGDGGFLSRLGREDAPDALLAEVYSFPAGTARRSGQVALSVEAEITGANCDTVVEAQTLELHDAGDLRVRDLQLSMPSCEAKGDFLVLKNLVGDLTIAAR
ncbi:translocase [Aestuariicoccus sp. KMU-90]|uniref:Translocase n=1 Tax=Thetidibacter halocola TaxID=2827239 RepID=A0A8J8B7Z6_9RHOB|nr:translocase [Thetidibacter halocola]